jgi:hypothetical protein
MITESTSIDTIERTGITSVSSNGNILYSITYVNGVTQRVIFTTTPAVLNVPFGDFNAAINHITKIFRTSLATHFGIDINTVYPFTNINIFFHLTAPKWRIEISNAAGTFIDCQVNTSTGRADFNSFSQETTSVTIPEFFVILNSLDYFIHLINGK